MDYFSGYAKKPFLSETARDFLCWAGIALVVGLLWTSPGWLMVLGVI